jgi:hypothetical protein
MVDLTDSRDPHEDEPVRGLHSRSAELSIAQSSFLLTVTAIASAWEHRFW